MPFVRPYVRADGTQVRGHVRWAPGARREMTILAVFGLVVLGFGHAGGRNENGAGPQPRPTVSYPIRFDQITPHAPRGAEPRPTVSYPVKFGTPMQRKAAPTPSVSYPIGFSAMGGGR
ncbi:hypothetical protein J2Z21_002800 [Streptomyces griseochromogenes]|uniref:Uncharacterized protein n=1 Tax=Streptomyces griseochromogenes TaxID=68214 RepID=A0A1B1AXZ5_9ACTN|nr:hypothetical protein AVL59_18880 [Streptomyces griseochromogenes]MBP2049864.1 hypothetical protein [Streptomyces griseochromogenes]